MATVSSIDQDRESVERVLHALPRPESVREPAVEFREDHTGDEAVYITFPVSRRASSNTARARALADFVGQIEESLYEEHLGRIPYVRFSETK